MKKALAAVALAIALVANFSLFRADEKAPADEKIAAPAAPDCDEDCDERECHWLADVELTFLKFHDAIGFATDDVFDTEVAPRITLGFIGEHGLGIRLRWWDYDNSGTDRNGVGDPVPTSIDATNVDLEVFTKVELSCRVNLEISGGIRYSDFEYLYGGPAVSDFSGYGGILGLKAAYVINEYSDLYVRGSWAFLMDDEGAGLNGFDVIRDQSEIGFGYEHNWELSNGAILTARIGAEWQNWGGYTFATSTSEGEANVGFSGIVLGFGIQY